MKTNFALLAFTWFIPVAAFGWGESGHHLIGRVAAKLVGNHPAIENAEKSKVSPFSSRGIQQGHLGNIPDIFWRNLEAGLEEDGQLLGDTTHFIDPEVVMPLTPAHPEDFFKVKVPLDYEVAKEFFMGQKPGLHFFKQMGTAPWRAQQLTNLYSWTLKNYPTSACNLVSTDNPPTRAVMTAAGILAHYVGDASQPYHGTADYDGVATGQKGIHSYFETDLVNAAEENGLHEEVSRLAERMLVAPDNQLGVALIRKKAKEVYPDSNPDQEVTALMFSLLANTYANIQEVADLDYRYALATLEEALEMPDCKSTQSVKLLKEQLDGLPTEEKKKLLKTKVKSPITSDSKEKACRRSPFATVNATGFLDPKGKPVVGWIRNLIVQRMALGAALTADIWVRKWKEAGAPTLCWTWKYALKPGFISPTDPVCFGYALKEDPKDFLKKDGTSALPWKGTAKSPAECLTF